MSHGKASVDASPSKKQPPPPLHLENHHEGRSSLRMGREKTQLAYLQDANGSFPDIVEDPLSPKKTLSPKDVGRSNRISTMEAKRDGSVFDDFDLKELEQLAKGVSKWKPLLMGSRA